jgi:hypothetical protein
VQGEDNSYSVPAALVRQNVNQSLRQVIAGHREGLIPQRAIDAAQTDNCTIAEVVPLDAVRRSALARPYSDYASVVAEVS